MTKLLSFIVTIAVALLVMAITMCVISGCGSTNQVQQQKAIKAVAEIAITHGEYEYQKALRKCEASGTPADCPKAERIRKWLDTGNRFLTYLDDPIPESQYDAIMLGLDVLLMEMQQQGADEESLLYVKEIRILFSMMGGDDAAPADN